MLHRSIKARVPSFYIVVLCILFHVALIAQPHERLAQTELLIKSRPESAYRSLQDILHEATEKNDPLTEAICHQQIGQIFYNNSNYAQAIDYLLQAEKILRKLDNSSILAKNLNYLGNVYYSNKQPHLAATQFDEALLINKQLKDLSGIALTYGNIGHLYEKKLMYDSAYYYQQKALGLYRAASDSMGMAKIFENLGSIFEDREKFDSARTCFERSLSINQQYGDEVAMIEILNNLGDISRKSGKLNDGLLFTRKAMLLAEKTQSHNQLASAYRDIAKTFELLHVFDSAYHYNEQSRKLVQEIYSSSNNRQTNLLETIYDVEKKNGQIAKFALDKKINTISTIAIILVIALLGILGAVVISRQRLKIRNEKALNEQNKHIYEKSKELILAELKNKQLEEEQLRSSLEVRSKELSAHTLHIIQKNQLLEELHNEINEIVKDDKRDQKKQLKQLAQKIIISSNQDSYWDNFRAIFDQVHQTFFTNLKQYADNLTPAELRLVALLRMNLNSGDTATLLGISQDSLRVARYRLKKKLNIAEGESLTAFIQRL